MVNVRPLSVPRKLLAIVEQLSLYPTRTVSDALARQGFTTEGVAPDLLDMSGSEACEVIEAEALVLQEGWAA